MMTSKPPSQLNSQFTLTITRYLSRAHTPTAINERSLAAATTSK
jgi:hypothetical protein